MNTNDFLKNGERKADTGKLTPRDLIHKHIVDKDHVVTEEELLKVKVGIDAEDEAIIASEIETKTNELGTLPDNDQLPNPYSVLR